MAKLAGLLELGRWAATPGPRPLVLVGPFEHHSNLLPWRESAAEVVAIGEDADGRLDLADLETQLTRHAGRPLVVGSFSAASNVTGILTDADRVAALLHRHGALSVWDSSAAAPYLPIRMGESRPGAGDHKDAVVFSPHRLIGGPRPQGSWSSAVTWPATGSRPCPAAAPWPTSAPSATATWTTPWRERRAAPRRSWSRSGPGWSSSSSRPSGPT